jgi:hypothetical protein
MKLTTKHLQNIIKESEITGLPQNLIIGKNNREINIEYNSANYFQFKVKRIIGEHWELNIFKKEEIEIVKNLCNSHFQYGHYLLKLS